MTCARTRMSSSDGTTTSLSCRSNDSISSTLESAVDLESCLLSSRVLSRDDDDMVCQKKGCRGERVRGRRARRGSSNRGFKRCVGDFAASRLDDVMMPLGGLSCRREEKRYRTLHNDESRASLTKVRCTRTMNIYEEVL